MTKFNRSDDLQQIIRSQNERISSLERSIGKGLVYAPGGQTTGPVPTTTLPTSPGDGDWCVFTDSTTAPTYRWLLQYETSDAYWYYLGGTKLSVRSDTSRTLTNETSYTDLPTDPASIAIPKQGDYFIAIGASILMGTSGGGQGSISYDVGGTAADDAKGAGTILLAQFEQANVFNESRVTVSTAGVSIAEKAKTGGSYSVQFASRRLTVEPIRIK